MQKFQVKTHLVNCDHLKVAIAQLYYELQLYNFIMFNLTEK